MDIGSRSEAAYMSRADRVFIEAAEWHSCLGGSVGASWIGDGHLEALMEGDTESRIELPRNTILKSAT